MSDLRRGLRSMVGRRVVGAIGTLAIVATAVRGQLVDRTWAPNTAQEGIAKTLAQQIGAGRGDWSTPDSSSFIISRDPFRAIRRGRQLFQRKFTRAEGHGPAVADAGGDIHTNLAIGAGLADSCAACHGRPRGSAGFGGDVATRPDSRDATHLFGLGLKEMLADEITAELRAIRAGAIHEAQLSGHDVTRELVGKGIAYGVITARPDGSVDTSEVRGVDPDLRVRPLFAHGGTISIREFVVGALQNEMGLQAVDPDLAAAAAGGRIQTPAGMVLDGSLDRIETAPTSDPGADPDQDGVANEIPHSLVDFFEFYLFNYFKPATYRTLREPLLAFRDEPRDGRDPVADDDRRGGVLLARVGCTSCHVRNLRIDRDRRVADVETQYDPRRGVFNNLFATATPLVSSTPDGSGYPSVRAPLGGSFLVRNIFTDFKRHDIGPAFYEREYDGSLRKEFLTTALWGVGTTAPYGHDGRSISLTEVILRHGGEAQSTRDAFAALDREERAAILDFLNSLVLFPPDDTASNLDPGDPSAPDFPQVGHGSIKLGVLFNDPSDRE
jgi:Di-haem oxidoreductase, putative peroxidase